MRGRSEEASRGRPGAVAVMLVSTLVVSAAIVAAHRIIEPRPGRVVEGVLVDGLRLVGEPEDAVRDRSERWLEEEVWLEAGSLTERLRRAELGLRVDVEGATRALLAIGRSGAVWTDVTTRVRARLGRVRVSIAPTLDRAALRAAIEAIAGRFDRPPVPAEIDDAGRLVTHPESGRSIDVEASVEHVADGLTRGERRFTLVVREQPVPTDTARFLRARPPVVIGSYVTRYRVRGDEGPRAVNVRVAAEALDGAIIEPGGRLSFNERVGPRTPERGYQVAHVIYDGEMVDGIGGGVCQVASTLHAAAFLAGLPVVEQVPHSRPSAYIPMGLDATVVYPDVDLVIGNPLWVPITVRARAEGGRMTVELWAPTRPLEVQWRREVLARTDYDERVVEDPSVPPGERVVSQEGGPGFVIERVRVVRDASGERTERRTLRYPPTDLVVRVAPPTTGVADQGVGDGEASSSPTPPCDPSASGLASPDGAGASGAASLLATVPTDDGR